MTTPSPFMRPPRMIRMRYVLLLLAVAGCFEEYATVGSTVNGPYTLHTVNGSALPFTLQGAGTGTVEIVSGVITLYAGGTYLEVGRTRSSVNGQVTSDSSSTTGSYGLLGNSVTLRANPPGISHIATISGNTMSIVEDGVTWAYRKN
ncbi:MAG: hypothetical protein ABMA00_17300 [Gemmatimonas sp.]